MYTGRFQCFKVGQETMYRPVIGKYSKHKESNDSGKKLIEFATERRMVIRSTHFQHKDIHKGTRVIPDGKKDQPNRSCTDRRKACKYNKFKDIHRSRYR